MTWTTIESKKKKKTLTTTQKTNITNYCKRQKKRRKHYAVIKHFHIKNAMGNDYVLTDISTQISFNII